MKKFLRFNFFSIFFLLIFTNIHAQETFTENQEVTEKINKKFDRSLFNEEGFLFSSDLKVLLFSQFEAILPGAGIALRYHVNRFGFEGSFSAFLPPNYVVTASFLIYFGNESEKKWYAKILGIGFADGLINDAGHNTVVLPFFGGYENKFWFWEAGFDAFIRKRFFFPSPSAKIGFCF